MTATLDLYLEFEPSRLAAQLKSSRDRESLLLAADEYDAANRWGINVVAEHMAAGRYAEAQEEVAKMRKAAARARYLREMAGRVK